VPAPSVQTTSDPSGFSRSRRIPNFRWFIVTLVLLAAVLNYVDRQTLSALAPTVQRDLGLSRRCAC